MCFEKNKTKKKNKKKLRLYWISDFEINFVSNANFETLLEKPRVSHGFCFMY